MEAVRYRAEAADQIRLCALDEVTLLFHRRSDQTHIVASPVPEILEALSVGEASLAELIARLQARYDLGPAAEAEAALEQHLSNLASLGLVRLA